MANVLLRSPYYISKDIGSDLSAKIEITIDGTLAYTIVKNKPANNNNFVLFEISELVRDYIDIKYNGSITASDLNVNVSYVLYKYTLSNAGGQETNLGTTTFFGIDGYGYFEEGSNPSATKGYMQSNDIIYTLYGEDIRIPVDRNEIKEVTYLYKGSQTFNKVVPSSSTEVFEYIEATDSFKERVIEEGGVYEEGSCINSFLQNNDLYLVDKVVLETGSELLKNGSFENDSYWNIQPSDNISNGALNISGAGSRTSSSFVPKVGNKYTVTFEITSYNSGSIGAYTGSGGVNISGTLNEVGVYTYTFTQGVTGNNRFNFYTSTGFVGSIDNVSIKAEGTELIPSIDLTSYSNGVGWFAGGNTPANTIRTSNVTSPIGDASAYNVTSPSGNGGYVSTTGIQGTDGEKVTISVFLKGTGDVQIKLQELGGDYTNYFTETITLTSNWVEHKVSGIKARDGNPSRMVIRSAGTSALDVDIWHPSVRLPETKIVDVVTLDECKYEPIKLTFVNRFGALQDLWFFKKSIEKVNTKKETFNRFTINSQTGVYDTSIHQNQTFNVNSSKKLTINTGYVDESYNDLMQELMQSEQIWLELNSVVTPINLDTNSLTFKTSVNDRLVDYTVDVSYSFDAINNIR